MLNRKLSGLFSSKMTFYMRENVKFYKQKSLMTLKTEKLIPYQIKNSNVSSNLSKFEKSKIQNVIANPEEVIKLSEEDIYSALKKTGKLPEIELNNIIQIKLKDNNISDQAFQEEINNNLLKRINLFLNKSLVELGKIAKNNPNLFASYEKFWITLQDEVMTRQDSLTNSQICEIISAFTKSNLTPRIDLFEQMEDLDHYERLFNSYCLKKKGSTAFLKLVSKKYFKYRDILDITKITKFYSLLNAHTNSIKGNFNLLPELEENIRKEIQNKQIKFEQLITIAFYLFPQNLGSTDIQSLIEKTLIEKFEDEIHIDMSQLIKLTKSLCSYNLKHKELCYKIKSHIEIYLDHNSNLGKTKDYTKLITNMNILLWSFSNNADFVELKNIKEFHDFYLKIKDTLITNIDYYNSRELVFSLEGLITLLSNYEFSFEEGNIIINKFMNLENYTNHDIVRCIKILIHQKNLLREYSIYEKLIKMGISNYEKLSYQELIDFMEIICSFSTEFKKIESNITLFQNKFNMILPNIQINYLGKIIGIISNPLIYKLLDNNFISNVENILSKRINEVPKEIFARVLCSSTKIKSNEVVLGLLNILEELTLPVILTTFDTTIEKLYILWTCLSLYHRKDWSIKLNHRQSQFIENIIKSFIQNDRQEFNISSDQYIQFIQKSLNIDTLLNVPLNEKESVYLLYLQTVFLGFIYLKENLNMTQTQAQEYLNMINLELFKHSTKFDLNMRSNFISMDAVSTCDKSIVEDIQNQVIVFFKQKSNCTLYHNFIDEFLNPVNLLINFELQKIKHDQFVTGIDSKIFSIVIYNKNYFNKINDAFTVYENRIKILKNILNFEVLEIQEEQWKSLPNDFSKQNYLQNIIGYDMRNEANLKTNIIRKDNKITSKSKLKSLLIQK